MKIINRYIYSTILKVGVTTLFLSTLIVAMFSLVPNLYYYSENNVPFIRIIYLLLLNIPNSLIFAIGPSFLFSVSYFISMLNANNEIICIYNSGISYKKIVIPILTLGLLISIFYLIFNEKVAIPLVNTKEKIEATISNYYITDLDNYDVSLTDMDGNCSINVKYYSDKYKKIINVILITRDDNQNIKQYITADQGVWNEEKQIWELQNAKIREFKDQKIVFEEKNIYPFPTLKLDPTMFRNAVSDISMMDLKTANNYIKRLYFLDRDQYYIASTEYYNRVFSFITPFVLILIACIFNLKFNKNILFFSIVWSVAVGIVYYVSQMVTKIMASQGIISPYLGVLLPFFVLLFISFILSLIIKN